MDHAAAIASYFEHLLEREYLREVLGSAPPDELIATLERMMRVPAPELGARGFADASLFIQDTKSLVGEEADEFRLLLPTSGIVRAALEAIDCADFSIRTRAVDLYGHHIGRNADVLERIFERRLGTDPLLLPKLVSAFCVLAGQSHVGRFLDRLVASPSYTTRWSAFAALDAWWVDDESALRTIAALQRDEVPWIADEARHLLRADTSFGGRMTYASIELRFLNELARTGRPDYSVESLEGFIEILANEPP